MAKNTQNARITPEDLQNNGVAAPSDAASNDTPQETISAPAPVQTPKAPVTRVRSVAAKQPKEGRVDAALRGRAQTTKEILDKQPKVRFMIPLDMGERKGSYHEVQINGYILRIQKGVFVDIPQSVANLLSESFDLTNEAGSEFRIDRDEKHLDALS